MELQNRFLRRDKRVLNTYILEEVLIFGADSGDQIVDYEKKALVEPEDLRFEITAVDLLIVRLMVEFLLKVLEGLRRTKQAYRLSEIVKVSLYASLLLEGTGVEETEGGL
jgi:hypothetical protein